VCAYINIHRMRQISSVPKIVVAASHSRNLERHKNAVSEDLYWTQIRALAAF
jgi:hypothetical protein